MYSIADKIWQSSISLFLYLKVTVGKNNNKNKQQYTSRKFRQIHPPTQVALINSIK